MFAAPTDRTSAFLQAILSNVSIPLMITFRYLILRQFVNIKQALCAFAVFAGIIVALIPTFEGTDGK